MIEIIPKIGMFLIPFLFALSVHEYAHGYVAKLLGDNTARLMGRLSLNPLSHADPIGTFLLPILAIVTGGPFFGWAKPVPVDDRNLKNPKVSMALVAAAGPTSNILMAIAGALIIGFTMKFFETATFAKAVTQFSYVFIMINLSLAFFNLIPIHPLDGGKILALFLPDNVNRKLEEMQMTLSILLLILFMSGGLARIIFTPIKFMESFLISTAMNIFGVM